MSDDENGTGREQPPLDPERALDELEERVLGSRVGSGDAADPAAPDDGADDPDPVEGEGGTDDAGTGVDAPTD